MTPELIETSSHMDELIERLNNESIIAVDTEFFRETTYYPQLALIQIATDSIVACIDPLAFDAREALRKLFLNSKITKIFHSCSQDLEVLFYYLGQAPNAIYDTQIANALLTDHHQISYAALVENELGTRLDKSQTRTNWLQRPLTAKQIQYAGDDVYYLYKLQHILDKKLHQLGRETWFDEDSAKLLANECTFQVDNDTLWRRVKGATRLNRKKLAIVQAIAIWREHLAQQKDRNRRKILADDIIINLALTVAENTRAIDQIIGAKYHFDDDNKKRLLDAITKAQQVALNDCPDDDFDTLDSDQKQTLKSLQQLINNKAEQLGISPAILSSRKELEKLILWHDKDKKNDTRPAELNILQGWRLHYVGQELIEVLK
ncbi:MAG: ribonuclease D [Gammaproteobacteria bacterium]|nr:ribonuclease D [Gammaproteobacteria bacterium]